jgi:hypothetical protein
VKIIHELPGALERPGGCKIELLQDTDGALEIRIPARGAKLMAVISYLLAVNLLVFFLFGLFFFIFQTNVPGITQTAPQGQPTPHGLPTTLKIGLPGIIFVWLLLEAIGVALLTSIMRSAFTMESILLSAADICITRTFFQKHEQSRYPIEEVNGFRLRHDPLGVSPSRLSIVVRGSSYLIAENAPESEREWINSIGNLHLKSLLR